MNADTELFRIACTKLPNRDADIVFVHGLDGDKQLTWQDGDDEMTFWPRLLYQDVPTCGVWSFGYDATSSLWLHGQTMPIVDRASNFAAYLRGEGLGEKPIFFVAHSLGGLIVKQMLRSLFDIDKNDVLVKQTKGIFFFSTPHSGSALSTIVQWLTFYRPSVLVEELEYAASPLRDLNYWYRSNADRLGIETTVFFETKKTKGTLVVDAVSADPGIPSAKLIPVDADHVEICKIDTDSMPYKTVRNAIERFVRDNATKLSVKASGPLQMHVSCFNKYPTQWEEAHAPKTEDRVIQYCSSVSNGEIRIRAEMPYLDAIRKGKAVQSFRYIHQPFRWLPLNLDLKFSNIGNEPLFLAQLVVKVEESQPIMEPLLYIRSGSYFPCLTILNDGWCEIRNPRLRINIKDWDGPQSFPDDFPIDVPIDSFEESCDLNLENAFRQIGVVTNDTSCIADLGPITSGIAFVAGELYFADSQGKDCIFRFATDISLRIPRLMMIAPPSFQYSTRLEIQGSNYERTVNVSHTIAPGDHDRFLLQLDVARTSKHRFRLEVEGTGGLLATSIPIEVAVLVPRSVSCAVGSAENFMIE